MAKKGGVQQLQAEINNDDEFEKFIERYSNALILLDVYSEWCGPCLGAVNALRKIKMELGGDRLQMAICKSDHITKLRRFRKRSEPTWLFIREQKSVNLQFSANIPDLMRVLKKELELVSVPMSQRTYIEIDELHPEEQKREKIKNDAKEALEAKERYQREKKRRDYLMFCTNAILDNLPDIGVCIFGTHVNRDMFKKLNEPADAMKMQCKDKRVQCITKEEFETANFACGNPLSEDVRELMAENNVLICFWKISDESGRSVPYVMNRYVNELTKKTVEPPDESNPEERVIPPIIEPIKIKVEYEVEHDVVCPVYETEAPKESQPSEKLPVEEEIFVEEEMEEEGEMEPTSEQGGMPAVDMPGMDLGLDNASVRSVEEEEIISVGPPPKKICTKIVDMPAVWVPNDERSHAALIYVFFRAQTLPFLPPDPPPEPPHIIMAFDTYKKRDLVSLAERNKNDIPMYGFFTSDDAEEAKFIANTTQKYVQQPSNPNDKLVFKVNKVTSYMMLTLATYGATYVSPNTTIGKEEALKFFPPNYRTAEDDRQAAIEAQKAEGGAGVAPPEPENEAAEPITEDLNVEDENRDQDAEFEMSEAFDGEGTEGEGVGE